MHDESSSRKEHYKSIGYAAVICICIAGILDADIRRDRTYNEIGEWLITGKLPSWINGKYENGEEDAR